MPVFTNISQMVREIDYLGKAVFKDVGDALAQGIWEEFEQLVQETAQYTGTAAASWNLSMGGDSSVRKQPDRTRAQALEAGHSAAVAKALQHNYSSLVNIVDDYRYKAIVVENNAESSDVAEGGPLRAENAGAAGAAFRFEQRVANKSFEIIRNRKL